MGVRFVVSVRLPESGLPNCVLEKTAENSAVALPRYKLRVGMLLKKPHYAAFLRDPENNSLSCRLNGGGPRDSNLCTLFLVTVSRAVPATN